MKILDKEKAFTIVEILVVIAIVAIVGTIMVASFTNTLRGSNKSQILAVIKQNGQAVLENVDKTIRAADDVVCVTPSHKTLVVVKDGLHTRYRFIPPNNMDSVLGNCGSLLGTANGCIQQDNPIQFKNSLCSDDSDPLIAPITLTDTSPQSGVSVDCVTSGGIPNCTSNPVFDRSILAGSKDVVDVRFALNPGVNAPAAITGQIDPVTFQTTVQLR